jgi:hypothetical protein
MRGMLLPDMPVIMANVDWPEPSRGRESGGDPNSGARGLRVRPGMDAGAPERPAGQTPHAAALERVRGAVADGALLVDIGMGDAAAIKAIRATSPHVIICAGVPGADLTRDPAIAARTGAALLSSAAPSPPGAGMPWQVPTPSAAQRPTSAPSARRAGATVTEAVPAEALTLIAAGHAVLADVDAEEPAAAIAVAAVLAWLGVRIVRTRHIADIRQALDMVESVRGARPPAWARRGLA